MELASEDKAHAQRAALAWFEEVALEPLGNGHIHQTYVLHSDSSPQERSVLQKINGQVYGDIPALMSQTQGVLKALSANTHYCANYRVPELVSTRGGEPFCFITVNGEHQAWRLWRFVENSMTCDPPTNRQQIRAAAKAFGGYQSAIAALDPKGLVETIPGFLNMTHYLSAFDMAVAQSKASEIQVASPWIALVQRNRQWPKSLLESNAVIHGDCKINNLLFDRLGASVLSVIDLDNNMVGHWAWDFGDLVRSVAFSRGGFDGLDYQACLEGFLQGRGEKFSEDNSLVENLVEAPGFLAFMLGLRFLTDHLSGDRYFKVASHGDNLQRAIEQFELFAQFQSNQEIMRIGAQQLLG